MEEMYTFDCTYSRIIFAKPHSTDGERIISANNLLKPT